MRHLLLVLAVLPAVLAPNSGVACTYVVDPNGTGDFPTIQAAVDATADGDVICLTDGTFTGDGNRDIDYSGKAITIRSYNSNPQTCIIDCKNLSRGFNFRNSEGAGSILEGVTITRGYNIGYCGALLCEQTSPTIRNCIFSDNYANFGAAVRSAAEHGQHNHPSFVDCQFIGNTAGCGGGGVYCSYSSPTVTNCTFRDNAAEYGAGMYCNYSSPRVTQCTFSKNAVSGDGKGGAVHLHAPFGAGPWLEDCTFSDNSAQGTIGIGGAIDIYGGQTTTITNCTFIGNEALYGGAIELRCADALLVACTLVNNRAEQRGGAVRAGTGDASTLRGCTLVGNDARVGGGIASCDGAQPALENCIIAFGQEGAAISCGPCGGTALLACCDLYGNAGGDWVDCAEDQYGVNGNFSADPLFCGPGDGSAPMIHSDASPYSLHSNSPCLAGNHPYGYDCGLIGTHGQGCGPSAAASESSQPRAEAASVEVATWGSIKAGYGR